jgi:hypothetical protein
MTDTELADALLASCRRQLAWYGELANVAQSILGKLVLIRGGMSDIREQFKRKQELLEKISAERTATRHLVSAWQERKAAIVRSPAVDELGNVLGQMETAIAGFLSCEEQIKRYLEHAIDKDPKNQ